MDAYTGFAYVYDTFMDNVPYDEWSAYLTELLREHGVFEGLIAELGCGTGSITRRLRDRGYDMIGIDSSEDMLELAREKEFEEATAADDIMTEFCKEQAAIRNDDQAADDSADEIPFVQNSRILYLNQDMREMELYGTVAAVVSICDSMNYLTSEEDMRTVFQLVNNYLDPQGIFIFDLNTVYKYRDILGSTTIAENREDCSFIWENYFDEESGINEYEVTIYQRIQGKESFERFQESHFQRAYELSTIIRLLTEAGMEYVTAYDACTKNPPKSNSERIFVIAKEKRQDNKKYIE